MLTFIALGFLMGLRHAIEPDHVAAVVSLSSRGGTVRDFARNGALWGVGHALTLLLLAGSCLVFGLVIPERAGRLLEGAVGLMLVGLGIAVFTRMRRRGLHFHAHSHDGRAHFHAHGHSHVHGSLQRVDAARDAHDHTHERPRLRTLLVGAVHGLAGSSALVLLASGTAQTPVMGLACVALFGLGSIVGMMLLAATIALPFGYSARHRAGLFRILCACAGVFSIGLGAHLVWSIAIGSAA